MSTPDSAAIERFMRAQVAFWNGHDKPAFMALYRSVAGAGLGIEYIGRDECLDGWFVIEEMWDKHNAQFELEAVTTVINGSEAAVHHRNCIRGSAVVIESIETYTFSPGHLAVRYFLKPPATPGVNLQQFRGFA